VEINSDVPYDSIVLEATWRLWNEGHRYYLSGGTDVHDVWNHESGRIRTFAHVDGPLTPVSYAEAVKNGHAYVSYGPLIEPAVMFGSELKVKPGVPFPLAFGLRSATGLKQVRLIGAGTVKFTQAFTDEPREARVEFQPTATGDTWFSLEVEDVVGLKAYSNPIWIDAIELPRFPARP
jgi:hypothetical protein